MSPNVGAPPFTAWTANTGSPPRLRDRAEVDRGSNALMATDWVVYSKPCLTRTETVVDYLGRYRHHIALSDRRLLDFDDRSVELRYTDYRDGDRRKVMTLTGEELLRRFLPYVLPKGFMRVHHFGFLADRCRGCRLADIRTALAAPAPAVAEKAPAAPFAGYPCPQCRTGRLRVIARLRPAPRGGG